MERKVKFVPGEYYHIYSRGVEKRKIFIDDKDHKRFIALLYVINQPEPFIFGNFLKFHKISEIFNKPKRKELVSILSYVLMPNHFHLLLQEKEEGGTSKFIMKLLTAYSMYFNTKYERSGPLFVHPFRSQHISEESQYLWIFSYIHLNPLKIIKNKNAKGSLEVENFLNSYKYSSYLDFKGIERSETKILDLSIVPDYAKNMKVDLKNYKKYKEYENIDSIEGSPRYVAGQIENKRI